MVKLTITAPGTPAWEVELKPGASRFGRSRNNDVTILHPSVSSVHCEMVDTDGGLRVKDLGSTNGTTLDRRPVTEAVLQPGQTLRLGEVEVTIAPEPEAAPAPGRAPIKISLGVRAANPPIPPPVSAVPQPPRAQPVLLQPVPKPVSFYRTMPGVFLFPLRGNGLVLWLSGVMFFLLLHILIGILWLLVFWAGLIAVIYLFSFMQGIVTTSAVGGRDAPDWPDAGDWREVARGPLLQMLGVMAVCLGPAIVYWRWSGDVQPWLAAALWVGGLWYLPMGLLAVAMHQSLSALNPRLIVSAILRVPGPYAATCAALGLLLAIGFAVNFLSRVWRLPLTPSQVDGIVLLYMLLVLARLAGLLYYTNKDRLAWAAGAK
jgi:hypothetical protein